MSEILRYVQKNKISNKVIGINVKNIKCHFLIAASCRRCFLLKCLWVLFCSNKVCLLFVVWGLSSHTVRQSEISHWWLRTVSPNRPEVELISASQIVQVLDRISKVACQESVNCGRDQLLKRAWAQLVCAETSSRRGGVVAKLLWTNQPVESTWPSAQPCSFQIKKKMSETSFFLLFAFCSYCCFDRLLGVALDSV